MHADDLPKPDLEARGSRPIQKRVVGMTGAGFGDHTCALIAERTHARRAATRGRERLGERPREVDRAMLPMATAALVQAGRGRGRWRAAVRHHTTTPKGYVKGDGDPRRPSWCARRQAHAEPQTQPA